MITIKILTAVAMIKACQLSCHWMIKTYALTQTCIALLTLNCFILFWDLVLPVVLVN